MPKTSNNSSVKTDEKRTTITIAITPEHKKALKIFAAEKETTISALINQWIEEKCKGAVK